LYIDEINIAAPVQLMNGNGVDDSVPPANKQKLDTDCTAGSSGLSHTRIYTFVNGPVASNRKVTELIDMMKPILRDAIEHMNKVKVWILLLIPRMEDGNNFGVSIQEEVLSEVRQIESEVATLHEQTSRYFLMRAKLITKVARYPHVDDYRRTIVDVDEKQFINLRLTVAEVRNHYATLHDLIVKNLEKIKKPRNTGGLESMY